jgi:RNA polymerase subunit RPABC4/transcription elongation factor Spt4
MFDQTCKSCGHKFERRFRFCPNCGTPAGGGRRTCDYCGAEMAADAKFCPGCGRTTQGGPAPAVQGNTWARGPEDFATRLEVDDLEGALRRDLIIEPGTQAMLLIDGRNAAGTVGPGRYTLRDLADRLTLPSLRRHVTALLVDTGETDLDLAINDIYTTDPLKISLDCHVAVTVGEPVAFITNLLKGARSFSKSQLRSYLYDEIQDAAQECVGQRSAGELHKDLALKQQFAMHIEAHLDETLKQTGLRFSRVRTVNFRHARLSEQAGRQEEYFLQLTKEEADLEHRKRLFDVLDRADVQAIAEETAKAQQFEQRSQLRERMRRAVMSDRFAELTGERETEQFLREQDRGRLLADDEWERIRRTIEWKRDDELRDRRGVVEDSEWARLVQVDDRERTRAQLLARLQLENEYELRSTRLLQDQEIGAAELKFQLEQERLRVERTQDIEAIKIAFDLQRRRDEDAFRREQEQKERARALEDARTRDAIRAQGFDEDTRQMLAELDVAAKGFDVILAKREREMAIRWDDERRRLDHQLEQKVRLVDLDLRQRQAEHEMQMARDAQAQQFELEKLGRLKDLPAAALVAAAGADQGRIIADMQQTEAMRGMTPEQILAKMSANSPEAARALAEMARAATEGRLGTEQVAMYERLLERDKEAMEARDKAAQQVADAYKDAAQRTQDIATKALDSQREGMTEIARATSHPPAAQQPPTVVVAGSGGAPTVVGGQAGAAAGGGVQCRRCGTMSPVGTRFCTNCGYEFFKTEGGT